MSDEFGRPHFDLPGADADDSPRDDLAGDRVAIAEQDFFALAQLRVIHAAKRLQPLALARRFGFAQQSQVADGGSSFDALWQRCFP